MSSTASSDSDGNMAIHVRTGYFVKEKVGNMIRWARNQLGDEVIPETLQYAILKHSKTEMLYVEGIRYSRASVAVLFKTLSPRVLLSHQGGKVCMKQETT